MRKDVQGKEVPEIMGKVLLFDIYKKSKSLDEFMLSFGRNNLFRCGVVGVGVGPTPLTYRVK